MLGVAPALTADQFADAVAVGDRFLAGSTTTPDRDEYHRVLLGRLGVTATPALLAELRRPAAPAEVLETFPEVLDTLSELRRRGVRMAVVSDAWPDLPELHAGLGLGGFFEAYAISAVLGCRKPDRRMYHHASTALGLAPSRCVFVDDDPVLAAAAIRLGYAGFALCRDGELTKRDAGGVTERVPTITSLEQILHLF